MSGFFLFLKNSDLVNGKNIDCRSGVGPAQEATSPPGGSQPDVLVDAMCGWKRVSTPALSLRPRHRGTEEVLSRSPGARIRPHCPPPSPGPASDSGETARAGDRHAGRVPRTKPGGWSRCVSVQPLPARTSESPFKGKSWSRPRFLEGWPGRTQVSGRTGQWAGSRGRGGGAHTSLCGVTLGPRAGFSVPHSLSSAGVRWGGRVPGSCPAFCAHLHQTVMRP